VSPSSQNGCDPEWDSSDEEKDPATVTVPSEKNSLKRQTTENKDGQAEVNLKKPKITIEPVKNASKFSLLLFKLLFYKSVIKIYFFFSKLFKFFTKGIPFHSHHASEAETHSPSDTKNPQFFIIHH
jgi:hypothetical protein